MTTEFELSVSGPSNNLLNAISVLASHAINLDSIATAKTGDKYVIKFITANEEECRRTFIKADLPFKERKVLAVEMYNRPGQWLKAAKLLVDAGVELQTSYLIKQKDDKMCFVFAVDDYDKAKKVTGQVAECSFD
jgi:hypothetical protein